MWVVSARSLDEIEQEILRKQFREPGRTFCIASSKTFYASKIFDWFEVAEQSLSSIRLGRALGLSLGCAMLLLLSAPRTSAETSAAERARFLSASPDAPVFGMTWRGTLRATLAAEIPVYGRPLEKALTVTVVPFVELHNPKVGGSVRGHRCQRVTG